jgi:high-affinity Fe2+/Pb2+ permease
MGPRTDAVVAFALLVIAAILGFAVQWWLIR